MQDEQSPPNLLLLGAAVLLRHGKPALRLERKRAGLLAYLALAGVTPRSTLAGLLWPETLESRARSNLRQTLYRLREEFGQECVSGDEALNLYAQLHCDVTQLELAAFAGRSQDVLAFTGELLGGCDFDDCPEFMDWLTGQRERLSGLRRSALTQLADDAEGRGDYAGAMPHALALLELDPISEVAHRRIMRLHFWQGDRGAALQAFGRCVRVLRHELNVEPMPETLDLARQIEQGQAPQPQVPMHKTQLPALRQQPPPLAGRETEWQRLDAAWERRQAIFISGPPGVGKSRLLREFMASKGEVLTFENHFGDTAVPYASLVRGNRRLLALLPDLTLEPWVKSELARIMPELGDSPGPMHSPTDKIRFYEAELRFVVQALQRLPGLRGVISEDYQFSDEATQEVWGYVQTQPDFLALGLRIGMTFRRHDLSEGALNALLRAVGAGYATHLELEPLPAPAVVSIIEALLPDATEDLMETIARHTGGNPLMIQETVRSLTESGDLNTQSSLQQWPLPSRLEPLLVSRIQNLSPQAGRLARIVAVAGRDFSLELAATALEVHPLDLAQPWAELERAQITNPTGFTHDLLEGAALSGVPVPIRTLLHRRVALYLAGTAGEPLRVAHHWQRAGEPLQAVPWLLKAAERSNRNLSVLDSARISLEAAALLEELDQKPDAFEVYFETRVRLINFGLTDAMRAATAGMQRTASDLVGQIKALHAEAYLQHWQENHHACIRLAQQALDLASDLRSHFIDGHLKMLLAQAFFSLGNPTEAMRYQRSATAHARENLQGALPSASAKEINDAVAMMSIALANSALIMTEFGQYEEADGYYLESLDLYRIYPDSLNHDLATINCNRAMSLLEQGKANEVRPIVEAVVKEFETYSNQASPPTPWELNAVCAYYFLSESPMKALESIEIALQHSLSRNDLLYAHLTGQRATVLHTLGNNTNAEKLFGESNKLQHESPRYYQTHINRKAVYLHNTEKDTRKVIEELKTTLPSVQSVAIATKMQLILALLCPPEECQSYAEQALKTATQCGLNGYAIAAHTRLAAALLDLSKPALALKHTRQAVQLLQTYTSEIPQGEVLFTHYRALKANRKHEAAGQLRACWDWLHAYAGNLPSEYKQGFLTHSHVNRAIFAEARAAGLSE